METGGFGRDSGVAGGYSRGMPPVFHPNPEDPDSDCLQPDPGKNYYIPRTQSKWTHKDLADKSVEFVWHQQGLVARGTGRFMVRELPNKPGLYIEIEANATNDRMNPKDNYHALYQRHVDQIEIHPESLQEGKPQFRMIA